MRLTALVKKGYKDYVALCLELDVASSGRTVTKLFFKKEKFDQKK
jgi:hypothetical protein